MTTANQLISLIQQTFEEDDELIILTSDTKEYAEDMGSDWHSDELEDHIEFENTLEIKSRLEVGNLEICLTSLTPDSLIKYKEYWENVRVEEDRYHIELNEKTEAMSRLYILPGEDYRKLILDSSLLEELHNEPTIDDLTSIIEGSGLPLKI